MAVILQHGTPSSSRSIEERLAGPVFDDCVVIVPTRRRIRHLVREVLRFTGNPVTPAFPFYTLELFAAHLYQRSRAPRRVVSGPLQTLLFEAAVRQRAGELGYFLMRGGQTRLPVGTFEKIMDVILHLRETGISTARLKDEALDAPLDEQRKLQDIAAIAEEYDAELERNGVTDAPGLIGFFGRSCPLEEFVVLFRRAFPAVDLLSLAGFDEFTLPELDILQLLAAVPGLAVTLLFDYESGNPALFGHLESNYRRFRDMGFVPVRDTAPGRRLFPINTISRTPSSQWAADHFARHLFLADRLRARVDMRESVTLIETASRRQEVQTICRLIRHLVRTRAGLDLGGVCVAMLRPQLYTDLFREECVRYGIPANITDRYQLSRAPVVVHIMNLLKAALSRYRRDDVLRVASSPFFSFGEGRQFLSVPVLAEVSGALRISGGVSQWRQKIDRAIDAAGRGVPGGREVGLTVARLTEAREEFDRLSGLLEDVEAPMAPRVFAVRLLGMLDALHVRENLLAAAIHNQGDLAERGVRAYAKFLDALDETVELMERQEGPEAPHTLRQYVDHLLTAVLRERFNVREQFGGGVLITSIDETRGLSAGTMIVAGLVDGEFPLPYQPEVFLSPERRRERERHSQWQNRYLFYQAVTNHADHLYLTYPLREGECELVRSSFVDSLLQVAEVERWDDRGGTPFRDDLLSPDEVLVRAARSGDDLFPGSPSALRPILEDVRHAVFVEERRMVEDVLPAYAGILSGSLSDDARRHLEGIADRPLSVTQLETYGKCPYQFFAGRLLGLKSPQDLDEELTALEKGSIVHAALFEFFQTWRDAGKPSLSGCSEETFLEASGLLSRILNRELADLDIPDAFWQLEAELLLGGSGAREGFVGEFLRAEQNRRVESVPAWFEVSFGGRTGRNADPRLSREDPVVVGSLRLRGKVDRIEIGDDFFTIVDYKTGSIRVRLEDIRRGMSLQLPLYLLAVQSILAEALERNLFPAAGLYYRLKTPIRVVPGLGVARYQERAFARSGRSGLLLKSDEEFDGLLREAVGKAEEFVRGIRAGRFPLTSPENIAEVCSYCDFRSACRIQTARHVTSSVPEGA